MTYRNEFITDIAGRIEQRASSQRLRVAIDGICASGKTTFAAEVVAELHGRGRNAIHVSSDGFHCARAHRYRLGRESAEGYYRDTYDIEALRARLLKPLGPNGDGAYTTSVIDLHADLPTAAPPVLATAGLVMVYDGTFALRPELADEWDVKFLLRVSRDVAEDRLVDRDRSLGDQVRHLARVRYHAAWDLYDAEHDPEAAADLVIDNDDPRKPRIVIDRLRTNAATA